MITPEYASPTKSASTVKVRNVFSYSLAEELPFEEIVDDVLIYADGSVGACYIMEPVYLDAMSEGEQDDLERSLGGFLNAIPGGLMAQIVWRKSVDASILVEHRNQVQTGDPLLNVLTEGRIDFWSKRAANEQVFGIRCEIWFRKPYPRSISYPLNDLLSMGVNGKKYVRIFFDEHRNIVKDFNMILDRVTAPLRDIAKIKRASGDEMFESIWKHLSGSASVPPKRTVEQPLRLHFGGIDVSRHWGYFSMGNNYERLVGYVSMDEPPETSVMGKINHMLALPFSLTVVMNIGTVRMDKAREKLRLDLDRYQSLMSKFDPESEKRAEEIGFLLRELESTNNVLFNTEMFFVTEAQTLADLNSRIAMITNRGMSKMGAKLRQEKAALYPVFLASLPGACRTGTVDRHVLLKTENVANLAPVLGPFRGANRPVMMFAAPYKTIYGYDPFDNRLPAQNMIVFGGTGAGKSFTMNLLLLSFLAQNPMVFIVDKGGSYKKLTSLVGGSYIDLSEKGISFNPLEGKARWQDQSFMFTKRLIFTEMIRETPESLVTQDERIILDRMTHHLYDAFARKPEYLDREPMLSDALHILQHHSMFDDKKEPELEAVQRKVTRYISRWTRIGTRDTSVNAKMVDNPKTNVSLDNPFVAFDLLGIEKSQDLMNVVFLTINDIIMDRLRAHRERYKIIVFDEAWSVLNTDSGGRFLEELYRTVRKYKAMVAAISQDINDFANSEVASAILTNTYQKFVLRQSDRSVMDRVCNTLELNDMEGHIIQSLSMSPGYYSDAFLSISGVGSAKMSIIPSPVEYWYATSNAVDRDVLENHLKQGYSLNDAIELLSKKFPNGMVAEKKLLRE